MDPFRVEELSTVRRILRLAGGEYRASVLVLVLGLAAAVFEGLGLSFLIPLAKMATGGEIDFSIPLIGPVLASLSGTFALETIHVIVLVMGFFTLGISVSYLNLVVSNFLAMRFAHHLRIRVFETALDRPIASIEKLASGKFVNNLASETWRVCDALFVVIGIGVQAITAAVFLSFLIVLSPFYTAVLVAMTLLMALIVHFATRAVRGMGSAAVAANEAFMAYVWDAIGGLRVIRGFGREAHERVRFAESSGRVRDIFIRMRNLSGIVGPITQIMAVGTIATILAIAALRGDDIATLIGFLAIAYRMQPRISAILRARTNLRSLDASVREIESTLAQTPVRVSPIRTFQGLERGVALTGVSARYPSAKQPVLHDISCNFPYGRVTAIAGRSGAGKSTLVALLLRFIEPERGQILIDGVPLSEIEPETWHRRIAFVEQNAFLFNATVSDNIGYGDLEADIEAIREAARIAQADEFIDALPNGYDSRIGDNGVRLSQGQRQRIALARALLRKPDILILDEATNALDRPTERALREAIQDARDARAIIIIAHRRETIENADQVVVLEKGRIIESGSPAELARADGVYSRLYLEEAAADKQ
jgi:subfamily B ATP-binding cassette protein MsbA